MTNRSVPALPLSRNDISSLRQAFKVALSHFKHGSSFSEAKYLEHLKVIVGSYVLTLVETKKIIINDRFLQAFQTSYSVLNKHPNAIDEASLAIAEMVSFVADKLHILEYAWFFKDFSIAIKETLGGKISRMFWDETEALRLVDALLSK